MSASQSSPELARVRRAMARSRINSDLARSLHTGRHLPPAVNDTTKLSPEDFAKRKAAREIGQMVFGGVLVMAAVAIVIGHLMGVPA